MCSYCRVACSYSAVSSSRSSLSFRIYLQAHRVYSSNGRTRRDVQFATRHYRYSNRAHDEPLRVTSHSTIPALRVVPSSTRHNSTNIDLIQKTTKDIESCELGAYSRSFLHSVVTIRYAVCASRLVAVRSIRSEQTFWAEYKYIEVCFHATYDHVKLEISALPPPGSVGQAARHLRPSSGATSASA
jgi:hypothetical protein